MSLLSDFEFKIIKKDGRYKVENYLLENHGYDDEDVWKTLEEAEIDKARLDDDPAYPKGEYVVNKYTGDVIKMDLYLQYVNDKSYSKRKLGCDRISRSETEPDVVGFLYNYSDWGDWSESDGCDCTLVSHDGFYQFETDNYYGGGLYYFVRPTDMESY
jgi:hypothetical protein